jgi:hypothetical protein
MVVNLLREAHSVLRFHASSSFNHDHQQWTARLTWRRLAGVRSFTQLSGQEKAVQLQELSHVVLGIRLLNKAMDKGGAGITEIDQVGIVPSPHRDPSVSRPGRHPTTNEDDELDRPPEDPGP